MIIYTSSFKASPRAKLRLLLITPLILTMLLLGSCESNSTSYDYTYEFCRIDSNGSVTYLPIPPMIGYQQFETLQDGRILISGDSLMVVNPELGTYKGVTRIDAYSYLQPTADLSPDGEFCYYSRNGVIARYNLQTETEEILAQPEAGSNIKFSQPTISPDGRYLCYLRIPPSEHHNRGYVSWIDLAQGGQLDMPVGPTNLVSQAWVKSQEEGIYYLLDKTLMWMNLQGTQHSIIRNWVDWTMFSSAGRFLFCLGAEYIGTWVYRDNQNMAWHTLGSKILFRLCRDSNILWYTEGKNLVKLDLETGTSLQVLSGSLDGRSYHSLIHIAPSWNGQSVYLVIQHRKEIHSDDKFSNKILQFLCAFSELYRKIEKLTPMNDRRSVSVWTPGIVKPVISDQ